MSNRRDRLRKAEKLLRQGWLEAATGEYVVLIEEQPKDWAMRNALGDLYVRAKQIDDAVVQYTRIADHFWTEGFLPKAAALYKKALKVKPTDEPSLVRVGEISAQQGKHRRCEGGLSRRRPGAKKTWRQQRGERDRRQTRRSRSERLRRAASCGGCAGRSRDAG